MCQVVNNDSFKCLLRKIKLIDRTDHTYLNTIIEKKVKIKNFVTRLDSQNEIKLELKNNHDLWMIINVLWSRATYHLESIPNKEIKDENQTEHNNNNYNSAFACKCHSRFDETTSISCNELFLP